MQTASDGLFINEMYFSTHCQAFSILKKAAANRQETNIDSIVSTSNFRDHF